jgi:predicted enzyme related to lactoylglutathione lyase
MIKAIAFTVYPVKDMAVSRRFYEETLLLKTESVGCEGHWAEYDVAGATFAITDMNEKAVAGKGGAIAFEVDDLEAAVARLPARSIIEPAFDTPVCRMAVVADPDGNELILHKRK